jgi:hypothetical protein
LCDSIYQNISLPTVKKHVRKLPLSFLWFFPGIPAFSTTKTGRHDGAESGVKHNK